MRGITVVCIVPKDHIVEAKRNDDIQGYVENGVMFSSLYTSDPQMLLSWTEPENTTVILYLPEKTDRDYVRKANKLISKLGKSESFYLVTEREPMEGIARIRSYKKDTKPLSSYFKTISKMSAKLQTLAA